MAGPARPRVDPEGARAGKRERGDLSPEGSRRPREAVQSAQAPPKAAPEKTDPPAAAQGGLLERALPILRGLRKLDSAAQPVFLPPHRILRCAPCKPEPGVRPGCKVT